MIRRESPFSDEVVAYVREVAPREVRALRGVLRERRLDALVALSLAAIAAASYFLAGRILMKWDAPFGWGTIFGMDRLFGWDVPRVVGDMMIPGHNHRSNVHPLFAVFTKPLGVIPHVWFGVSMNTCAIAIVASVQASSVAAAYVFYRLRGAARPESAIFAALFGTTFIGVASGTIPETGVFSMFALWLNLILATLAIRHGRRPERVWFLVAFFAYGITVTNVIKSFVAFGLSGIVHYANATRLWARSVVFGTSVVGAGVLATVLVGSSLHMIRDRFIVTPEERGGHLENLKVQIARELGFNSVVACRPSSALVTFQGVLRDTEIVTFNEGKYTTGQFALAAVWGAALAAGIALSFARTDRAGRMLGAIPALWLAWDYMFFYRYYLPYEGLVHWSVHVVPPYFALLAPLAVLPSKASPRLRAAALAAAAGFLVLNATNSFRMLFESARMLID